MVNFITKIKDYYAKDNITAIMKSMWKFMLIEFVVFSAIILFDLLSKELLFDFLLNKPGFNYTVINGVLDLRYSENTGAGFGMFSDATLALSVFTSLLVAGIFLYLLLYHRDHKVLRMSLVFISAGGVGNLVDRTNLGYVRDFFEFTFMDFAIFNVADTFITIGGVLLILYLVIMIGKEFADAKKQKENANGANENEQVVSIDHKADQIVSTDDQADFDAQLDNVQSDINACDNDQNDNENQSEPNISAKDYVADETMGEKN